MKSSTERIEGLKANMEAIKYAIQKVLKPKIKVETVVNFLVLPSMQYCLG